MRNLSRYTRALRSSSIKPSTKAILDHFKAIKKETPKVINSPRHKAARDAMAYVIRQKKKTLGSFGMRAKLGFADLKPSGYKPVKHIPSIEHKFKFKKKNK